MDRALPGGGSYMRTEGSAPIKCAMKHRACIQVEAARWLLSGIADRSARTFGPRASV